MSTIPDNDKDTKIPKLNKYWFSFGFGHHHGPDKISLRNCYTIVEATSYEMARSMMIDKRGFIWAFDYPDAESCGVERFRMGYIKFEWLKAQHGPTL